MRLVNGSGSAQIGGERRVSPVAEVGEQCPYEGLGLAAVGALEVATQGSHSHPPGRGCGRGRAPVLGHW